MISKVCNSYGAAVRSVRAQALNTEVDKTTKLGLLQLGMRDIVTSLQILQSVPTIVDQFYYF